MSAVIFASVALLTTSTLVSTLRLQTTNKQNQLITTGGKRALDTMREDILSTSKSSLTNVVRIHQLSQTLSFTDPLQINQYTPNDTLLALVVPQRAADGTPTGTNELHVYCAELQGVSIGASRTMLGKRIARYVLPSTAVEGSTPNPDVCIPSSIQSLYNLSAPPTAQYLTDQDAQVVELRFFPVWATTSAIPTSYVVDPPAIRIELTLQYNPFNVPLASTVEQRVSDKANTSPPLVLRSLISRSAAYSVNAQP